MIQADTMDAEEPKRGRPFLPPEEKAARKAAREVQRRRSSLQLPVEQYEQLMALAAMAGKSYNAVLADLIRERYSASPPKIDQLLAAGAAAIEGHRYVQAVKFLRQATRLDPVNVEALFALGTAFERARYYPDALKAFSKAVELDPKHIEARVGASRCMTLLGDDQGAVRLMSEGVRAAKEGRPERRKARG